jgi:hypothetical protein
MTERSILVVKLLVAALAAVALMGPGAAGAQVAENAGVRVVHASPDAPPVDVYANGSRVLSNVRYKGASDYLSVPPGQYTFEVRPAGAAAGSSPVLSATTELQAGTDYTVMAIDRLSQIKGRIFVDKNAVPAAGKAHVQVVHASPDAPTVDIALKGGPVLVPALPFGELKGQLPVDAGTYNLEIRVAGTDTVALPLDGVTLEAGKIYTFIAVGLAQGSPALSVLPLTYTPAGGHISAPRAGDAGLLDSGSDSNLSLPLIAGVIVLAAGALFGARTVLVRGRKS